MELGNEFEKLANEGIKQGAERGAFIAGAEIQSIARGLVPVDTTALKISISNEAKGGNEAVREVGPNQPYGKDIEFGRPPGTYVSPAQLSGWARRKGLNPYAVSRAIQKKGTRAQPFLFPAFNSSKDKAVSSISDAISAVINYIFK